MQFYSNKAQEIVALDDGFKRRYMLSAFKLMMKDHGEKFDFAASGMPMHFTTKDFKSY
jgi:anaerobic magnesium-protoporphyrin IX monomethyl ester cyclase